MKQIQGIGIEETVADVRDYHTRDEISQSPKGEFRRPLRPESGKFLERVGECGTEIIRNILNLPGVVTVGISPYLVTVIKSPMFTWDELENQIIEIILNEFPSPNTFNEVGDTFALDEDFHRGLAAE